MKASFVVTGFGPFHGVKDNPTSVLVQKLPEYLLQRSGNDDSSAPPMRTLVLETSASGAKQQIDALYDELCPNQSNGGNDSPDRTLCLLHLGVHSLAQQYLIESCAYNEATFVVPDEAGDQPKQAPILAHCVVGTPFPTMWNVPELVEQVNALRLSRSIGELSETVRPAVVSTNPGRFVCNYTYCYSLDKFQCSRMRTCEDDDSVADVRCLFVHVPSFQVAPEEEQLQFIVDLMDTMEMQLQNEQ
jgi:pyroglutamyl-peptidase